MVTQDTLTRTSSEGISATSSEAGFSTFAYSTLDEKSNGEELWVIDSAHRALTSHLQTHSPAVGAAPLSQTLTSVSEFIVEVAHERFARQRTLTAAKALLPSSTSGWQSVPWEPLVSSDATENDIIGVLRLGGLRAVADRLVYLQGAAGDDPEEEPMALESLRKLAMFLISERQLRDPQIGISPGGLLLAQWRLPLGGIVVMKFLLSGLIQYAAISDTKRPNDQRLRASGTMETEDALVALRPFTSQLTLE